MTLQRECNVLKVAGEKVKNEKKGDEKRKTEKKKRRRAVFGTTAEKSQHGVRHTCKRKREPEVL